MKFLIAFILFIIFLSFCFLVSRRSSKLPNNFLSNNDGPSDDANGVQENDANMNSRTQLEDVLVVPLQGIDYDCPGMLNEDKVTTAVLI